MFKVAFSQFLNRIWTKQKQEQVIQFELKNGLQVVLHNLPFRRAATVGLWVPVGSCVEKDSEAGYAHFVEHMLFKGTKKRSYQDISREIESLGGYMNASTNRETTACYIQISGRYLNKALEVLADVFYESAFEAKELEKEREVIIEEIRMSEDDPAEVVYEAFYEKAFPKNPFGRSIGGTIETISAVRREQLFEFYRKNYGPQGSVLSIAGGIFQDQKGLIQIEKAIRHFFDRNDHPLEGKPSLKKLPETLFAEGEFIHKYKKQNQVIFILGLPSLNARDKNLEEIFIFTNAVGGSMSSRLFRKLREERGLCYHVSSNFIPYYRTGVWSCDSATGSEKLVKTVELMVKEIRTVAKKGLNKNEVEESKKNIIGLTEVALESPQFLARSNAFQLLNLGKLKNWQEHFLGLEKVSDASIYEIIQKIWKNKSFTFAMIGQEKKYNPTLKEILREPVLSG